MITIGEPTLVHTHHSHSTAQHCLPFPAPRQSASSSSDYILSRGRNLPDVDHLTLPFGTLLLVPLLRHTSRDYPFRSVVLDGTPETLRVCQDAIPITRHRISPTDLCRHLFLFDDIRAPLDLPLDTSCLIHLARRRLIRQSDRLHDCPPRRHITPLRPVPPIVKSPPYPYMTSARRSPIDYRVANRQSMRQTHRS